jgi:biopolymer transport protein ExbB
MDLVSGLTRFLEQADEVGLFVFALLLLMSAASWTVILVKACRNALAHKRALQTVRSFWDAGSFDEALQRMQGTGRDDSFARLARAAERAWVHHRRHGGTALGESVDFSDFLTRQLRNGLGRIGAQLEWGQTLLASVGSTAPFVGLFGTVWGIYHALISIGDSGQATLDKVAGPVGEALIMTGLGLAVAIPAVLAYNAFTRSNRVVLADLDGFAHDLHVWLVTKARLGGHVEPSAEVPAPRAVAAARGA